MTTMAIPVPVHGLMKMCKSSVLLSEPGGSSAEVLLYGGQVVSWKNKRGEELLFRSNKPLSRSPYATRDGISVSLSQWVRIEGLETLDYLDCLLQRERFTEQADAITFDGEVHRIYLSTPPKIAIIDLGKKRTFVLHKEDLQDTVLWNPWDEVSKALPDFSMEDYKIMMLVDSTTFEKPNLIKNGNVVKRLPLSLRAIVVSNWILKMFFMS